MARTERKQIDWESVEKHYRAGKLSIREIGRQCGCDEKQVRRRAKAEGWHRDLSEKINEAVRSKVVRSSVRTENNAASDREIIEANAEAILKIRLEQRQDITRAKRLTLSMLSELEDAGKEGAKKPLSLTTRVDCGKKLAETMRIFVSMENEAWGIDDKRGGDTLPMVMIHDPEVGTYAE